MIHDWCDKCNGRGSFDCSCSCSSCTGKGTVQQTCTTCGGKTLIACSRCSGSGQVVVSKSWLFGEKYGNCSRCSSSGQVQCQTCKSGYVQTPCFACSGTGAKPNCPTCQGKKKIACSSCGGKGKVRPNWSKERIREEIAERRRRIAEIEEDLRAFDELYERNPDIGYQGNHLYTGLDNLNREISELMSWL
jgi:hypothetical protein